MSGVISFFCMPGGHAVEYVADPAADMSKQLPPGWRLLPADVIPAPKLSADDPWTPGIWYFKPDSDTKVLCCPDHDLTRADAPDRPNPNNNDK